MSHDLVNPGSRPSIADPGAALELAMRLSGYARRALVVEPELASNLAQQLQAAFDPQAMEQFLDAAAPDTPEALACALRRLRRRVMMRVLARDLAGAADLKEVTGTMSALADLSIRRAAEAHRRWLEERHGAPAGEESGGPQELVVVAMGKLGGFELNVSSDVDLVFVYPEEGQTAGPRVISNHEFFNTLGRRIIAAIHEPTADGFVFRVDMRLRPFGESGPLTVSFASLENYFITQGREWERYAWIKARPVCGAGGDELLGIARPFVFRKYLDFGAYGSMRDLHAQIRQEVQRRDLHGNIKLGPGGIREIEFIAQVFQLIRGGRVPSLRIRPTLQVLRKLAELRQLPEDAVRELSEAYDFLRRLEHRLQYLDDAQTQTLPRDASEQALMAEAMGCADYAALMEGLDAHRRKVERHFDAVFASREPASAASELSALWERSGDPETVERLAALGYRDAPRAAERLSALRTGSRYRQLPRSSQESIDALAPALVDAASRQPQPDPVLDNLLAFLEAISGRAAYLSLLREIPQALERLAKVAAASRWAADYLTQHPILLDELLDDRELYAPPDWPAARRALDEQLATCEGDPERQMDTLRHFQHAMMFRLLAKDLEGLLLLETLSDHLTELADIVLGEVLRLAWQGLRAPHREGAPRFAIVGYGKLGGKELGYASDLDMIFLYDDDDPRAPEVYARLASRINTWLTSYTAAGILYDTDLRLRPDGASGLMVSALPAFRDYQLKNAWVWEHQALTRARFVTGDRELGEAFEALRHEVLCLQRDAEDLRAEVRAMRQKMLDAHPNKSGLLDLKHDRGGIIDVEFVVQFLVLAHAHRHPELTANIGNLALLRLAGALGLISADSAEGVRLAYREFRRRQHALRLQGEKYARVAREEVAEHADNVLALWDAVMGAAPMGAG